MWSQEIKIDYSRRGRATSLPEPGVWHPFRMGEVKRPEFANIGRNEILLGFSEFDENEPATIPFDPHKRISILVQGNNSAGKTILVKNLVFDQLHARFGRKVLDVTPKGDSHGLTRKNTKQSLINKLKHFRIKPKAYNVKFISPKALDISGAWAKKADGYEYKLGMDNFLKIREKGARLDLLLKLFNTTLGEPVARALQELFLIDNPPANIRDLKDAVDKMSKPPPTLEAQLNMFLATDVLGDVGCQYPKLLNENGILSIETGLSDPERETLADIFLEDAVISCLQDRKLSVMSENKQGNLSSPFTFCLDEADTFANKNKPTSNLLTMLLTKYREIDAEKRSKGIETYGCDMILSTQHIHTISRIIIKEIDWVLMPKLTDERDGDELKERGLDSVDLYDLSKMEFGDTYPKPWVAISRDGEKIPFRPLPSASYM